ncbi:hypothetical protein [Scytonema millei]|uniref:Uncharacterized protein n=1 Tax=Scytonema millei VB511283 TaxID=1245923 RepID=A0A9X5E1R2_9CYAN|nr:hypothetical protein [Scytonema millei]NHC33785.1 hypothetical protein [Scytonema millei VB511283]
MEASAPAVPLKHLNVVGLARVYEFLMAQGNFHLISLLGAATYAGGFLVRETESGTHFMIQMPSSKSAQEMIGQAVTLFFCLEEAFPISRLLISTTKDPFMTVPADYWISLGSFQLKPNLYVGVGQVEGHPDWYAVVKLDEDGKLVREK